MRLEYELLEVTARKVSYPWRIWFAVPRLEAIEF